jgi:F-type H+-transporting ATPase subunit alpha
LAWLTAFNEGLFNQVEPKDVAGYLERIDQGIKHTTLTLDSSLEQWLSAVSDWLNITSKQPT